MIRRVDENLEHDLAPVLGHIERDDPAGSDLLVVDRGPDLKRPFAVGLKGEVPARQTGRDDGRLLQPLEVACALPGHAGGHVDVGPRKNRAQPVYRPGGNPGAHHPESRVFSEVKGSILVDLSDDDHVQQVATDTDILDLTNLHVFEFDLGLPGLKPLSTLEE